ncbi:MAG: sugar phosphate isomerase/epimerase family protein [Terriglobales bacterium]
MNRRDFLSLAAVGAAGLGFARRAAARPSQVHRLACNSWPFRAYFDTPGMSDYRDPKYPLLQQWEFPEFLADTFGLHHVEFLPQHFAATDAATIAKVKAGLRKAHAATVNLMGVDTPGGIYNPRLDPGAALANGRLWVDIARQLGSPSATFVLDGRPPWDPRIAARNLRPIRDYAARHGIRILFHDDSIRRESAPQILAVIRGLGGRDAGTCPDFGNFAPKGAAFALATLKQLAPYCTNICHAKDGIGEGGHYYRDNFPASMAVMKAARFRGHYSLEYDGPGAPIPHVRHLMQETLAQL